ncbi:MAG: acireductone synthase [Acidobacteriaceae bacterium]|nr:acireductone synthase [Acidobacteriaceae bacterium]
MARSEVSSSAVLLDIEGTTTPIRFVYETLFPYARDHGPSLIRELWDDESLRSVREQLWKQNEMDQSEGAPRLQRRTPELEIATVIDYYRWLMDRDRKLTPLKTIQGLVWERGFETGELRSEVFADVPPALSRWREAGRQTAIYSSGSALAQQQLFRHSNRGDLTGFISAYFDTRTGGKREAESYSAIARQLKTAPGDILFISDVLEELDAARDAGLTTVVCVRAGNADITKPHSHRIIRSFDELS